MSHKLEYMPEMDGLRAVAVVAVLFHHWFQPGLPVGGWGVTLFFVISGYLITKTIVGLRGDPISVLSAARIFFLKRSLRLFPAYYLVICLGALMFQEVRQDWPWYVFYGSNILLDVQQRFVALTPTWSLAIEEQFYLVWFFTLMLVRSRSKVAMLLLTLVLVAPLVRYIYLSNGNVFGTYTLWAQCDALAAGAFLFALEQGSRKLRVSGAVATLLFIGNAAAILINGSTDPLIGSIGQTGFIVVAAYLVWRSRSGFGSVVGDFLSHPRIIYLGKISYGIYLYHMLTPEIAHTLGFQNVPIVWRLFQSGTIVGFLGHIALTIGIAMLSFRFFESPIRHSIDRQVAAIPHLRS